MVALVTLLRLKMKVRGGGSATRVGVDSNSWFEFSYMDMMVEVGVHPSSYYYRKNRRLSTCSKLKKNGLVVESRFNGPKR